MLVFFVMYRYRKINHMPLGGQLYANEWPFWSVIVLCILGIILGGILGTIVGYEYVLLSLHFENHKIIPTTANGTKNLNLDNVAFTLGRHRAMIQADRAVRNVEINSVLLVGMLSFRVESNIYIISPSTNEAGLLHMSSKTITTGKMISATGKFAIGNLTGVLHKDHVTLVDGTNISITAVTHKLLPGVTSNIMSSPCQSSDHTIKLPWNDFYDENISSIKILSNKGTIICTGSAPFMKSFIIGSANLMLMQISVTLKYITQTQPPCDIEYTMIGKIGHNLIFNLAHCIDIQTSGVPLSVQGMYGFIDPVTLNIILHIPALGNGDPHVPGDVVILRKRGLKDLYNIRRQNE
jgi:hypothetical protein